jgi:small-conductance mechanosensitive channel
MSATLSDLLQRLNEAWALVPNGVGSALILVLAALIALGVHTVAVRLLRPLLDERHPYWRALLQAADAPGRLALLVLALFVALPSASFDGPTRAVLEGILSFATIVLAGWLVITAAHLASELYLVRFLRDDQDTLVARKHVTQVRVLRHVIDTLIVLVTASAALMTFEPVRQIGVSLFASAGVAGLVAGLAARPMLSNLIAGIQIATSQPIRIDDEVVVETQWGRVHEITSTYVVLNLWDLRQLIVPLSYFIEKPFENWTRDSTDLIGAVSFYVDYMVPIERVRAKVMEIVQASPLWDGKTAKLLVNDAKEFALELRVLASARSSGAVGDLRCAIREQIIEFLQQEYPNSLPHIAATPRLPVSTAKPGGPPSPISGSA